MTQLVAERSLFGIVDGEEVEVVVRVWVPERVGTHSECRVTFQSAAFPINDRVGHGVDDMQALIEALHMVGYTLDKSGVEWSMFSESPSIREDGFPRAGLSVMFYGSDFRKRMESYVEGEKLEAMKHLPTAKRPPTLLTD